MANTSSSPTSEIDDGTPLDTKGTGMMKILVLPLVLCGLIVVAPQRATAATDPLLKCASSKLKAASKKEAGKFNCLSKDAAKPDPVKLSACIAKVESDVRSVVHEGRFEGGVRRASRGSGGDRRPVRPERRGAHSSGHRYLQHVQRLLRHGHDQAVQGGHRLQPAQVHLRETEGGRQGRRRAAQLLLEGSRQGRRGRSRVPVEGQHRADDCLHQGGREGRLPR